MHWRVFRVEGQAYVLHTPSSSFLEVSEAFAQKVELEDASIDPIHEKLGVLHSIPPPKPHIRSIALNVIEQCNLRCTYCFAGEGNYGKASLMSFNTAVRAIRFFTQHQSNLHIIFFGGEPLLNFQLIKQVVAWCQEQKELVFTFGLTTNGTLLKDEQMDFLQKYSFAVKISYDGKNIQEKTRKTLNPKSSSTEFVSQKLEKYSEALASLREFKVRMTLDRRYIGEFKLALLDALSSKNYQIAFSRVSSRDIAYSFGEEDLQSFKTIFGEICEEYLAKEEYTTLLKILSLKQAVFLLHRGPTRDAYCGAGLTYLSVSTHGKFYLCHRFTEDEEESLGSIETGLNQEKIAEITEHRMLKQEPCNSCWLKNYCKGGCFHEHKMKSGNIRAVDPIFCKLQTIEFEMAVRVYVHLLKKAPTLLENPTPQKPI